MDRNRIGKYFRTIKHLKLIQIYYRLFYFFRNRLYKKNYSFINIKSNSEVSWNNTVYYSQSYLGNNIFEFLNQKKKFDTIDWNFNEYGKLWNYNLVYFDFLNQKKVHIGESLNLIHNFIYNDNTHVSGHEPYTISLRNVNWIKFILSNNIKDQSIDDYLYSSYKRLLDNLEFHLLGNHLMENAFSLLFGAYYFNDRDFYRKSEEILLKEFDIQILDDGGHFELSPMYHSIILQRILDSLYLMDNNNFIDSGELNKKMHRQAVLMLSWLKTITYKNNDIPHFNDSTDGIALSAKDLFSYAESMGLQWSRALLSESGYRKYSTDNSECIIDVGSIGPDYLPGHGHSDISNFEFRYESIPFIVDTGTSTYENNKKRQIERSNESHNTIMINDISQSEVWNSFRVARRAKITNLIEQENMVSVSHDGYKHLNINHNRKFIFKDRLITIKDTLTGSNLKNIKSFLHFHPDRRIILSNNSLFIDGKLELRFTNYSELKIIDYNYSIGFNKTVAAKKMIGVVKNKSKIEIIHKG